VITVKDQGKGILKELQVEKFDRFFRAQKNDQYKSKEFGIGFSHVKAIVVVHDGKIILNETYKNECEFIISFDERVQINNSSYASKVLEKPRSGFSNLCA